MGISGVIFFIDETWDGSSYNWVAPGDAILFDSNITLDQLVKMICEMHKIDREKFKISFYYLLKDDVSCNVIRLPIVHDRNLNYEMMHS